MQLSIAEINLILDALNDREGVLSSEWEAASRANSVALVESISSQMREVRALAGVMSKTVAKMRAASPTVV